VRTEGVAFTRPASRFTADFEDLVGFLATTADKTTICRVERTAASMSASSVPTRSTPAVQCGRPR
jgi:hypothetical protein